MRHGPEAVLARGHAAVLLAADSFEAGLPQRVGLPMLPSVGPDLGAVRAPERDVDMLLNACVDDGATWSRPGL